MKETKSDVIINDRNLDAITIKTGVKWYTRVWYLLSNPFLYLFGGQIRY